MTLSGGIPSSASMAAARDASYPQPSAHSQGYQNPSSLQRAVTSAPVSASPSASALSDIYASHSLSMTHR